MSGPGQALELSGQWGSALAVLIILLKIVAIVVPVLLLVAYLTYS